MKLFLLRPQEDLPIKNPWVQWYDKCFGFVIRAENESEAREMADANAMDENNELKEPGHPWLDPVWSMCTELTADGEREVIIYDIHMA